MEFQQTLFFIFSAILVFAAGMVITIRNPVKAVLFLVLAFFTAAALWLMLEAEFLAITLVLVYVGAVMVLFLFVVMMLDINLVRLKEGFGEYLPIGAFVAVLLLLEMALVLSAGHFGIDKVPVPAGHPAEYSNTQALGMLLYRDYIYVFEIAGIILLVAIIVAIALTMRRRKGTKYQSPAQQIQVRREDRVRLVKMKTEKKR